MSYKDHEKISAEAIKMLEPLLVDYYRKPYQESYQLLRRKIEANFRGKDTNSKYMSIFIDDLEDLISTVILRLVSINSKSLKEKGERIRDLESMVNKITDYVYREELRAIRKRLKEQLIDENDPENKTPSLPQPIDDEIQTIRSEIIKRCYEDCVERLPAKIKDVFRAYYPKTRLDPKELVATRRRLATEVAGMTLAQSQRLTPEQAERTLNNLQSKVNKWRRSHIEECVKKCVEAKESQHPRLNYLNQQ
jgi:ribosomal protein L30/L7E